MEFQHKSVLLQECIDALNIRPDGIYLDGTLGGAGHSSQIARRLTEGGRLIGVDRDRTALAAAKDAGIAPPPLHFPLIARGGRNRAGKAVRYLFNYSGLRRSLHWFGGPATELVGGKPIAPEEEISLPPWGLAILEEA